jgi:hypothetical protein
LIGGVQVIFQEIPPLIGDFVRECVPIPHFIGLKTKFIPSLLPRKKISLFIILNVIHTMDAFAVELKAFGVGKSIFEEFHPLRPPNI